MPDPFVSDHGRVCLWGSPGAGKTGFLGCLFDAGSELDGAGGWEVPPGEIKGTAASEMLVRAREELLSGENPRTPPQSDYEPVSLLLVQRSGGSVRTLPLSLTDPAGEFSIDVVKLMNQGRNHLAQLAKGGGIIWLIDGAKWKVAGSGPTRRDLAKEFVNLLKQVVLIAQTAERPRVGTPLALCLSRIDLLPEEERRVVRADPEAALKARLGPELFVLFERIFPVRRCFAISATGTTRGVLNPIGVGGVLTWLYERHRSRTRAALRRKWVGRAWRAVPYVGIALVLYLFVDVLGFTLPWPVRPDASNPDAAVALLDEAIRQTILPDSLFVALAAVSLPPDHPRSVDLDTLVARHAVATGMARALASDTSGVTWLGVARERLTRVIEGGKVTRLDDVALLRYERAQACQMLTCPRQAVLADLDFVIANTSQDDLRRLAQRLKDRLNQEMGSP